MRCRCEELRGRGGASPLDRFKSVLDGKSACCIGVKHVLTLCKGRLPASQPPSQPAERKAYVQLKLQFEDGTRLNRTEEEAE